MGKNVLSDPTGGGKWEESVDPIGFKLNPDVIIDNNVVIYCKN